MCRVCVKKPKRVTANDGNIRCRKMLMAMNAVKRIQRGRKQRNEDVFNVYYVCSGLDHMA
jgi:hypothetical protein